MLDFKDQVVVVTGSGSPKGIGRVIARTFAKQGATAIIADLNEAGLKETVDIIQKEGGKAEGVVLDVTNKESVDAFVAHLMAKYGRIDVLINNAGISQKVTVEDMTLADMERIFRVNMFGLFLVTQACVREMKKKGYGRVVSLSSVSAKRGGGIFGGAHYSASKAAVLGFSKNLAREVAADGITIVDNVLSTGVAGMPVAVFALDGKQVLNTETDAQGKADLSVLAGGTYLVSIVADGAVKTVKFVRK